MKKAILYTLLLLTATVSAQIKTEGKNDATFPTFYQQRSSLFRLLPLTKGDVIFLGNSITNGSEWDELFSDPHLKNRGISGDVAAGVLNRLDEVIDRKPAKIFLLIGINDLAAGTAPDTVAKSILLIAKKVHNQTPYTQLYVQSLLPVNDAFNKFPKQVNKLEQIKRVNQILRNSVKLYSYNFIDLFPSFCNKEGKLDTLYTNDGLHEKGPGYMLWKHLIYPAVYDLQTKPSLIPLPQSVVWQEQSFPVYQCRYIIVKDSIFKKEAISLQEDLLKNGWKTIIQNYLPNGNVPLIIFEKRNIQTPRGQQEAYQLKVSKTTISIQASSGHGCFNAIQSLVQLMRDNSFVPGVEITDYPAYNWRGYMVDVGRNFQTVALLKQQIAVMATYKMNVFHLHLTEDIAWRLQIKQYPQLTEANNMLRNKGAYYTVDELKDLIDFCKERYITLVPEIDMPGHSAAFKRVFGVDMQSDSGLHVVKNVLKELCSTYDVPYLHIGGDEVKITDQGVLPSVLEYVHQLGKQTIGWSPGGNLDNSTIRQLWMKEGAVNPQLNYIDSRNLYINHMDPLESVVSIFNRKIGDENYGSKNLLGGTLCLWPDRNVIKEDDILRMNPVYPALLTFAERSWLGGGTPSWNTAIIPSATDGFAAFENRLTDHQKQYFSDVPFPYIKQAVIKWKLFGPYKNKGDLSAKFPPEEKSFIPEKQKNYQMVTGGTVILKHFWYPEVKAVLANPTDSSTYYAFTKVWSKSDTTAFMWIGFYNISRSVATSTPKLQTWDDRKSMLWINQQVVSPPKWARAGQTGNLEYPLIDEGYEYRSPVSVYLKKGWNQVLVKLPVGSFHSTKGQSPVKWMFTAVFVKPFGRSFIADPELSFTAD